MIRFLLCTWKGSLMKTKAWILDNGFYFTRKIELHKKKARCLVLFVYHRY